ncbi:MAG: GAF domain-containing protein [Anaerolineales bacterium]|nr:GAF domain-containing protein [Anaerolineales bacterium]
MRTKSKEPRTVRPARARTTTSDSPPAAAGATAAPAAGETGGLYAAAQESLDYILQTVGRAGGAVLVQPEEGGEPLRIAVRNAPAPWKGFTENPDHPLRKIARRVLKTGAEEPPDPKLNLAAAIPLLARSSKQGVLLVAGEPFAPPARARLVELAHVAGRTLRISRSMESMQAADKELASLHMIASILSSDLELDDIQKAMLAGVRQIMDCEFGCLILVGDGQAAFERKILGEGSEWMRREVVPMEGSVVAECLRNSRPVRCDDPGTNPRLAAEAERLLGSVPSSYLCAPLRSGDESIGMLDMFNKRGGPFTPYDQELISLLATSMADAIYNKRLILQTKQVNLDLKANREELLNSRNTLRALFDNLPASLYIVDRAYALRAINRSRAQRAASRPNLLVGRCCYEALFHRISPCPDCRVAETLEKGKSTARALRLVETAGDAKEWEISTYPILDEAGAVVQVVLFEEDVTERRHLEANLAQSEKLAAVGQLAAGVAHEINNPLTAVIANAQLMQRSLAPDSEMQESVELILIAGSRAAQVVRNLLDFARKEQYRFDRTEINETIRKTLELVQHEVLSRSIVVKFDPDPDLPRVMASGDHLQGVWLNLILNAFDALSGMPGEIWLTTRVHDREVQVVIEDTGKGIPAEILPRIFEPFFTTKLPGQGTGLGLSVCHQIIKQHGGTILAESEAGHGTRFTVSLPIP